MNRQRNIYINLSSLILAIMLISFTAYFFDNVSPNDNKSYAQNNIFSDIITIQQVNNNRTIIEYILVFAPTSIGNVDNETRIVPAYISSDSKAIGDEFLEEVTLHMEIPDSISLRKQVYGAIENGINGIPCNDTIMTYKGNIGINCTKIEDKVIWYVYPIR